MGVVVRNIQIRPVRAENPEGVAGGGDQLRVRRGQHHGRGLIQHSNSSFIMTKIHRKNLSQNFLISFGVFWLSLLPVGFLAGVFQKLDDGIRYGDSLYSAIAMGVMTSLGQTVAAILAGVLVTLAVSSRKPERWALVVATLYVVDAPVSFHWGAPPMLFHRLWQSVTVLFPAVACVAAAAITARLRRSRGASSDLASQSAS